MDCSCFKKLHQVSLILVIFGLTFLSINKMSPGTHSQLKWTKITDFGKMLSIALHFLDRRLYTEDVLQLVV